MNPTRLLAGPPIAAGAESLADHRLRLGARPRANRPDELIAMLDRSGLLGRGGAGFPAARKWSAVAGRSAGDAVVLVNGAEGEPLSAKDRTLMNARPHLVLDGAELAAEAVGADRIILYVGADHANSVIALRRAIGERGRDLVVPAEVVVAPATYVAGEESAAVQFVDGGEARPTGHTPRPFERGVDGRPTLVQNVETLAHVGLIARYGDQWYRELGNGPTRGSALVTVGGDVAHPGVTEIAYGTTVRDLLSVAGGTVDRWSRGAVLLGGYFGGWLRAEEAANQPLDPRSCRDVGSAFGCGVVHVLPPARCGVVATARILDYMAGQSAAQCGPCVFGLRAIADATARIAAVGSSRGDDLAHVVRWSGQLAGRGACKHPDGAVGLLRSALRTFSDEFDRHQRHGACIEAELQGRVA
jgi:NADH:ubiquinone oxidoreductase subunit F (NADH-binding)